MIHQRLRPALSVRPTSRGKFYGSPWASTAFGSATKRHLGYAAPPHPFSIPAIQRQSTLSLQLETLLQAYSR